MKTLKNFKALLFVILMLPLASTAQDVLETIKSGQVRGDYQINAQYYVTDSAIGAYEVPEKFKMNAYGNILYTNGNFTAGLRYEAYLNPLEGFDPRYKGNGIPYRFVSYKTDFIELTAGNFYEQFGSGLIFRSYQEWTLGYDNSVDGINVKLKPFKGVTLKGIYGTQRFFWEQGPGIIRGGDAEFFLNDIFPSMAESKLRLTLGGFIGFKEESLFKQASMYNIMFEGYITYGGMSGRDMNALAMGWMKEPNLIIWKPASNKWNILVIN